jgi:hypothetical protein
MAGPGGCPSENEMNIDEIAVKVARELPSYSYVEPYAYQKRFANALLAELAKQEPVARIISRRSAEGMKASDLHDLQGALRDLRFIQASALVSAKVADTKIGKEYMANLNRLDTLLDVEKTKALREESAP